MTAFICRLFGHRWVKAAFDTLICTRCHDHRYI